MCIKGLSITLCTFLSWREGPSKRPIFLSCFILKASCSLGAELDWCGVCFAGASPCLWTPVLLRAQLWSDLGWFQEVRIASSNASSTPMSGTSLTTWGDPEGSFREENLACGVAVAD